MTNRNLYTELPSLAIPYTDCIFKWKCPSYHYKAYTEQKKKLHIGSVVQGDSVHSCKKHKYGKFTRKSKHLHNQQNYGQLHLTP